MRGVIVQAIRDAYLVAGTGFARAAPLSTETSICLTDLLIKTANPAFVADEFVMTAKGTETVVSVADLRYAGFACGTTPESTRGAALPAVAVEARRALATLERAPAPIVRWSTVQPECRTRRRRAASTITDALPVAAALIRAAATHTAAIQAPLTHATRVVTRTGWRSDTLPLVAALPCLAARRARPIGTALAGVTVRIHCALIRLGQADPILTDRSCRTGMGGRTARDWWLAALATAASCLLARLLPAALLTGGGSCPSTSIICRRGLVVVTRALRIVLVTILVVVLAAVARGATLGTRLLVEGPLPGEEGGEGAAQEAGKGAPAEAVRQGDGEPIEPILIHPALPGSRTAVCTDLAA